VDVIVAFVIKVSRQEIAEGDCCREPDASNPPLRSWSPVQGASEGMNCAQCDNELIAPEWSDYLVAAGQLGVQPINLPIHDLADVERGMVTAAQQPNGGILFPPDVTVTSLHERVVALLARYRVPAIFPYSLFTAVGGLVSYGPDLMANYRQSAFYVDRILRGEKPGDLPFQQPSTYHLIINLKAAKALGLTVPNSLFAAADEVIE
jgi:putative tryptophan/tyrosine transport system substrate-binding protein